MKSVIIIIPYDNIYPPMNGGMQRCFHIMHQLSKHFALTAIIKQDKDDFLKSVEQYPALSSAKIFSIKDENAKKHFSLIPQKLKNTLRYRWYKRTLKGPADGNLLGYYPILTRLLNQQIFDVAILESMATLNAISVIRRYNKKVKIIYDAHNVDSTLAKAALTKGEIGSKRYEQINQAESHLHHMVHAIFACSENDKATFLKMNQEKLQVAVVPNGVNIPKKKQDDAVRQSNPEYIVFCGSLWSIPNAEGLHWFCKKIWPLIIEQIPSLKLLVVGSGELPGKYADIFTMQSIEFTGAVNDVKTWYNKAALAVVPLLTGSGTRLKVLEAMGLGVPVVSTSIGAEGIAYSDSRDIIIADSESAFAESVIRLLNDKEQRLILQENAGKLVQEKYDWNIIGDSMAKYINN